MNLYLAPTIQASESTKTQNHITSVKLGAVNNSLFNKLVALIITEAYQKIDIDVEISFLPGKRSLLSSAKGKLDGETNRIVGLEKKYPSLVPVNSPYISINGVGFYTNNEIDLKSTEDLKQYRLAVLNGIIFTENMTKGMNPSIANSTDQLFKMLVNDRVDIILFTEFTGRLLIAKSYSKYGIKVSEPLLTIPLNHYLHESKRELVSVIKPVLDGMISDGRIDAIKEEFLSKLRSEGS